MRILAYLHCVVCLIIFLPTLGNAGCINKYGCAPGYQCVKGQFQMEGVCVKIGDDEYDNAGGGAIGGLLKGINEGLQDSERIKRQWRDQELHDQQMRLMEEQRRLLEEQRRALEEERQTKENRTKNQTYDYKESSSGTWGKSCEDDCRDMYYSKELKKGISIKECIRQLCN